MILFTFVSRKFIEHTDRLIATDREFIKAHTKPSIIVFNGTAYPASQAPTTFPNHPQR